MRTPTKIVARIPDGSIDWPVMDKNFEDISDDIDELNIRIDLADKRLYTQTITYLLESPGYTTVLSAEGHGYRSIKLVHAFMVAADAIQENVTVNILRENKDLCKSVTIKASEKLGKAQSFSPYKTQVIGKMEAVKLYSNSRRKVIVTLILSGAKQ